MNNEDNRVRMQDILEDTINHYGYAPTERRAQDSSGSCQYTDSGGNHCAVGRYMRPEFQTTGFYANDGMSVGSLASSLDTYLESKVLGLSEKFWSALQELHDSDNNWSYDGLTECGRIRCAHVKDRIEAGGYD